MNFYEYLEIILAELETNFNEIDTWFEQPGELRSYRPQNGGWNINEILEHIALTNHYLLILIDKGKEKALKKEKVEPENIHYSERGLDAFEAIGKHNSFSWPRPDHMEPTGSADLTEVREKLKIQLAQCIDTLKVLNDGRGIHVKTMMSVNSLGKIDVYEYIHFLALHAKRHVEQIKKVEKEFEEKNH